MRTSTDPIFSPGDAPYGTDDPVLGEWDDQLKSYVVRRTGEWIVSVTPMIFNDRILLTHVSDYPYKWTAGWCYDKGGAAFFAAHVYDPDTMQEPVGYKKLAADER